MAKAEIQSTNIQKPAVPKSARDKFNGRKILPDAEFSPQKSFLTVSHPHSKPALGKMVAAKINIR
jgi:hypothetical protein